MTRKIVVPGEVLAERPLRLNGAIVEGSKTCATVMGIFDDEKSLLIPLEGLWYPKSEEKVIGIVEEAKLNSYTINLNAPYKGILIAKFVRDPIDNNAIIEATVRELDKTGTVVLVRPRVLTGGKLIYVKPSKIPRIIGRGNTMIGQVSNGTSTTIEVGMNGLIWMRGGNTDLATEAIMKIQEEGHTSGLTDRISSMLNLPARQHTETYGTEEGNNVRSEEKGY